VDEEVGRSCILYYMSELAPAAVRTPAPAERRPSRRLPTADSIWWLALVAGLFTCAQLVLVVPRLGLSWDETVYVSQLSVHAPAAFFDPARARGVPLLVAPVALLTGSIVALRVYLAIASGIGLFLALLTWRGLRPAWILALAAAAYGTLWVAIYYGPQAMPDEWVAFSALAAVGFFLRATGAAGWFPTAGSTALSANTALSGNAAEPAGAAQDGAAAQPGPAAANLTPRAASQAQFAAAAGAQPAGTSPTETSPTETSPTGTSPTGTSPTGTSPTGTSLTGPGPVGLASSARTLDWRWLAGLAGCVAIAALVRPGDAVFLSGALVLAVLLVKGWRRRQLVVAIAAGLVAGCAEWVIEAYLRFGGPLHRLHLAGAEQGGFGFHLAFWDEFKAANGPTLCRPCTVAVRYPELSLWWIALPLVALLGILVARRAGRLSTSLLPALCAVALAFQYLFLINYAAPRFLLPAYGLAAIPVADALGWLLTGVRKDLLPMTQVAVFLAIVFQILVQGVVLNHQVAEKAVYFGDYGRIATDLHRLGVRMPCLIKGGQYIPIAYYAGCESAGRVPASPGPEHVVYLLYKGSQLPRYARGWTAYQLPNIQSKGLRYTAYISPSVSK
jgi:hypothetical protein